MSDRESDIAKLTAMLIDSMFAGLSPDERVAREKAMNDATRQQAEQIDRQSKGANTDDVPDLTKVLRKAFEPLRQVPQAPESVIGDMVAKLYDKPETRAALLGSEEEKQQVIGAVVAREHATVARQLEAMGARPLQGAVLESYEQAGQEMAKRLPGLMESVLSGTAPGGKPEEPEKNVDTVQHIDGTKMGSARPLPNPALAARTAQIRENLEDFIKTNSDRELSQSERIALAAQTIALGMNGGHPTRGKPRN